MDLAEVLNLRSYLSFAGIEAALETDVNFVKRSVGRAIPDMG
jgi:hypothetical protein